MLEALQAGLTWTSSHPQPPPPEKLTGQRMSMLWKALGAGTPSKASSSDTMYSSISFRKSTPPQYRQLNILIGHSEQ
jgi:hypothetical protein